MAGDGREEFFQESQELVDALARDLLSLEGCARAGTEDPELVNDIFRSVHTLKGIAGVFAFNHIAKLSHELENKLDDMRMGRVVVTVEWLDILFKAVEVLGRMLANARKALGDGDPELPALLKSLKGPGTTSAPPAEAVDELASYDLDPEIVRVLTEREEHRLRTNVRNGTPLFRLRARFPMDRIDKGIDELKQRAKPLGELITFFPTGDMGGDSNSFELDILFASQAAVDQLRSRLEGTDVTVHMIERREGGPYTSAPPPGSVMPAEHIPRAPAAPKSVAEPSERRSSPAIVLDSPFSDPAEKSALDPRSGTRTPVPPKLDDEPSRSGSSGRISHTVRVDIRRLDHLMNVLGELAIVRGSLNRMTERLRQMPHMREIVSELHRLHRSLDRNLSEMQTGILEVRMVPLGQVFERLARAVRQIARQSEKEIRLVVTGAETEVDKLIVEELSDPLLHIVRNSIDHGIESAVDRAVLGKPAEGTIALNAYQAGNHVIIEIEDDGAGIDRESVIRTAVKRGLLTEEQARETSARDALNLIFLPGFSTRDSVSDLSGRGVGLDIVKTNIGRLGGVVDVSTDRGTGSKFTITLPITLAILRALLIGVAGRTYALPLSSVAEATILDERSIRTVEGREITTLRGESLPLCRLEKLFDHQRVRPRQARANVVVVALGGRRVGMVVDELFGQQDIVIKALGSSLAGVKGFAGATDLGEQRVGLVLDAAALLDEILAGVERRTQEAVGGAKHSS
jgi:two-component system chemotaxis sensor kinase CheA